MGWLCFLSLLIFSEIFATAASATFPLILIPNITKFHLESHLKYALNRPWREIQLQSFLHPEYSIDSKETKEAISTSYSPVIDCITSTLYHPNSTIKDLKLLLTIPSLALKVEIPSHAASSPSQLEDYRLQFSSQYEQYLDQIFHQAFEHSYESKDYSLAFKIASAYEDRNQTISSDWIDLLMPIVERKARSHGKKSQILEKSFPDLFQEEIDEAMRFINSFEHWDDELHIIFNEEYQRKERYLSQDRLLSYVRVLWKSTQGISLISLIAEMKNVDSIL
jgi:hypothetical protein